MEDMVVSTRVRLARNFKGMKFPTKMTKEENQLLHKRVLDRINTNDDFREYHMQELTPMERQVLVERHIASAELIKRPEGFLLLDKGETLSILVGEEDHLRIQCILPGWKLQEADEQTRAIDHTMSVERYAFENQLGYLTSCVTNVGTGMRASVMLHLAALTMTNQISMIAEMIGKFGFTIRGYYGEGSSAYGSMYQVSNQVTLGVSEEEIMNNLTHVIRTIIERERAMREILFKKDAGALQDRLHRSLGILKYARRMSVNEMMTLMSDIKLGLSMRIFEGITIEEMDRLLTRLQSASICAQLGEKTDGKKCEEARAKTLRMTMKKCVVF